MFQVEPVESEARSEYFHSGLNACMYVCVCPFMAIFTDSDRKSRVVVLDEKSDISQTKCTEMSISPSVLVFCCWMESKISQI